MIILTTLRGEKFALNDELIEKVEADPETRVILSNGTRYIVSESMDEVARRIRVEHAETQVLAKELDSRAKELVEGMVADGMVAEGHGLGAVRQADVVHFDRGPGHKPGASRQGRNAW